MNVADLLRRWFRPAPPTTPTPTRADPDRPLTPPPSREELLWARREAEMIERRARALGIDVDLERAVR